MTAVAQKKTAVAQKEVKIVIMPEVNKDENDDPSLIHEFLTFSGLIDSDAVIIQFIITFMLFHRHHYPCHHI